MVRVDTSKFLGKSKEYTIMGEKVLLEPLKGKDMHLFMGISDGSETAIVKNLVMHYFELTEEEFNNAPMNFINETSQAIMDVNGFSGKK